MFGTTSSPRIHYKNHVNRPKWCKNYLLLIVNSNRRGGRMKFQIRTSVINPWKWNLFGRKKAIQMHDVRRDAKLNSLMSLFIFVKKIIRFMIWYMRNFITVFFHRNNIFTGLQILSCYFLKVIRGNKSCWRCSNSLHHVHSQTTLFSSIWTPWYVCIMYAPLVLSHFCLFV